MNTSYPLGYNRFCQGIPPLISQKRRIILNPPLYKVLRLIDLGLGTLTFYPGNDMMKKFPFRTRFFFRLSEKTGGYRYDGPESKSGHHSQEEGDLQTDRRVDRSSIACAPLHRHSPGGNFRPGDFLQPVYDLSRMHHHRAIDRMVLFLDVCQKYREKGCGRCA